MGEIKIDSKIAQQYATAIGKASDKLAVSHTISFSSEITVQGNQEAKSKQKQLTKALTNASKMLKRDTKNIHQVVEKFQRVDQKLSKELENGVSK